jgi:stage IV sporulation protein FB
MVFYVNKAKIRIEYSFLLMIAFSVLLKSSNIAFVLLFSSLHEIGHLIALLVFGGRAKEINISFYGIGLKYDYSFSFLKELVLFSAGIIVNLILCLLNINRNINLSLALINMLPLYPLDGGRILKLILNKLFYLNVSDYIFKTVSFIVLALLVIYSIYAKNYSLILIIIYIIIFSLNNTFE